MAAPWFNEIVTIFTAVEYYKNEDGELNHHLIAAVSDSSATTKQVSTLLTRSFKKLSMVHYWSDEAVSQFKNRFNLSSLLYH